MNETAQNLLGETLARIRTTNDRIRYNADILRAFYERVGLPYESKTKMESKDPQPSPGISHAIAKEFETQKMLLNEQEDLLSMLSQIA